MFVERDENVSAEVPDWSREDVRHFWDAGPKLIRSIRRYQAAKARGGVIGKLTAKYWVLVHRFWSLATQCEIHLHTQIEGGLRLPHPTGIVLHQHTKIGPNCMIFQQVTLAGPVELRGHVDVGAGAKLIGPLEVAPHVTIGANAVVVDDVAEGLTVGGIPAKPLKSRK